MPEEIRADLLLGRDTLSPGLVKAGKAADDASANVKQLTRSLYEVGKQRATPVVDLKDDAAKTKLEQVQAQLAKLRDQAVKPKIDLQDKDAVAKVAAMRVKLDALGRKVSSPRVTLDGVGKVEAQLLAIDASMDRLSRKRGNLSSLFGGGGLRLGSRLGGLGGILGSTGSALGTAGSSIGSALGPLAITGGIGIGALLLPSLLDAGLGGLIGAGGAGGALLLGSKASQQLQALQQSLSGTRGAKRQNILAQIAALRKSRGGELGVFGAFQGLGQSAQDVFSSALEALGAHAPAQPGRGGLAGQLTGPGAQAPSFLQGLSGILKQIAGFVKSIGPQLGAMFRASLPFLQAFVKFLERAAKVLLPAFTQVLQAMAPSLPLLTKGLVDIVKGVAGFLEALGPQALKVSAEAFVFFAKILEGALKGFGQLLNLIVANVPKAVHDIATWFDWLRHHTATVFDGIRHDVAHYWDLTFENSIGTLIRFGHNLEAAFDATRKFIEVWIARVEVLFGGWAKNILHFAQDAFGWLPNFLPGVSALKRGLDTAQKDLASFVGNAKATLARLTGKPYGLNFVVHLPPGVGRADVRARVRGAGYASGTSGAAPGWAMVGERGPELMHFKGGETVIPNHALRGYASGTGGVVVHLSSPSIREMASVLGGYVSGIVRAIRSKYVVNAFGTGGGRPLSGAGIFSQNALESLWVAAGGPPPLAHLMAAIADAESGGNPNAYNPSGASGLWQILGQIIPGNIFNPYVNAENAVAKYRSQGLGAWVTYTSGAYKQYYDQGGWLRPGWTMAYNGTGRPEQVVPHGSGGSGTVNNYVTVQVGHGTHPVAAAQEIVKLLNVGAKSGVKLRSSILGPG